MEIDNIEYHIKPFNDFLQIIIFEEDKKFKIGLSFIGNFGTDSFIVFKNLIVGAFGYLTNKNFTNKGLSVKFRSVSSRQDAIKQAIEKANEIYNSK